MTCAFMQEGSPRFATTISNQNWKIILKHIVLAPQFFHNEQIKKVMTHMEGKMPEKSWLRLNKLLEIGYSTVLEENFDISICSIKTLSDLQNNIIAEKDTTFVKDPLTGEEDWSISPMEDLGPLGLTAKQTAESLCLELSV